MILHDDGAVGRRMVRPRRNYGSAGSPFSPKGAGAVIWLDASDTSGSVVVTGSGISSWTDLSGHGWTWTQGTDARRMPLHAGGINGRATAQGTGAASQGVVATSTMNAIFGSATAASVYVAGKLAADGVADAFGVNWGTADSGSFFEFSDGNTYSGFCASVRNTGNAVGAGVLTSPFAWACKSAVNSFKIDINWANNFTTAVNTVTFGAGVSTIGNAGANGLVGDIGEIIAFPFIPSAGLEAQIRSYFKAKWATP